MKTPEDEAFDDIARKQGAWGGGFTAKRKMAADKLHEDRIKYGASWEKDGKRIDPMSVYKEPVTEREALKLALEALEEYADHEGKTRAADEAITAIKEALAQPAQAQRPWVGLTDEEIDEGNKQSWVTKQAWESAVWWASEKLKEKNG